MYWNRSVALRALGHIPRGVASQGRETRQRHLCDLRSVVNRVGWTSRSVPDVSWLDS